MISTSGTSEEGTQLLPCDGYVRHPPHHVCLWGLCRSARLELAGRLEVRICDLEFCDHEPMALARQVMRVSAAARQGPLASEPELALRGGTCFAPRLVKCLPSSESSLELRLVQRGSLSNLAIQLQTREARSAPGRGHVKLRVRAVGLNFRDVLNVMGLYPGDPG